MATKPVEQFTAAATANVEKLASVAKDSAEALSKSGTAVVAGLGSLAAAYQDVATRNFEKFTASIKALSSVKSPEEFFEVQQKLLKESFDAIVADSHAITEMTTAVFTAAIEPVQKQVEAVQNSVKKAA